MGVSASGARTNQEVDDVDDAIPPSPLSRRIEGEASLLQDVPPVTPLLSLSRSSSTTELILLQNLPWALTTSMTTRASLMTTTSLMVSTSQLRDSARLVT